MKHSRWDKKKEQWVPVKHKHKLLAEREATITQFYGFPFSVRTKPTTHEQRCHLCRKTIEKGQRQVVVDNGKKEAWLGLHMSRRGKQIFTGVDTGVHSMPHGFDGHKRLVVSSYVYFHTKCFTCGIVYMMRQAKVPIHSPICDTCDQRFGCFTGESEPSPYMSAKRDWSHD